MQPQATASNVIMDNTGWYDIQIINIKTNEKNIELVQLKFIVFVMIEFQERGWIAKFVFI